MIDRFIKEDAVVNRLSTATKVKRILTLGSTLKVSKPQPKNEMDLIVGQHTIKYYIYTGFNTDIVVGDYIDVLGETYAIAETEPYQEGNLQFKRLKAVRD
jgi:hypothetical protein